MAEAPFSRRHGYSGQAEEIAVWEDAPESLRFFVLSQAERLGLTPSPFRDITCFILEERPDSSNWSPYPNIWGEVEGHVYHCQWFQVYDIIEAIWAHFHKQDEQSYEEEKAPVFEKELNDFFVRKGIGWQLVNGLIVTRGAEAFEQTVKTARATLEAGKRPARTHIDKALGALSRRPSPNLPGAIYHAMGCLECVARDVAGDEKATLGEILKKHPGLLPRPLDTAIEKMWGYASNEARHMVEGQQPRR
jgi:AbiJ N-terminal domain 4